MSMQPKCRLTAPRTWLCSTYRDSVWYDSKGKEGHNFPRSVQHASKIENIVNSKNTLFKNSRMTYFSTIEFLATLIGQILLHIQFK